jgi:hypothetical protein
VVLDPKESQFLYRYSAPHKLGRCGKLLKPNRGEVAERLNAAVCEKKKKCTYPVLARCRTRILLELDVLICTAHISFAAYWPATGQQNSASSRYPFESENDFRI